MKHFLEKISILSLSLLLVSTYAVTPALPAMISFFAGEGRSVAQVEFLVSVTSFAIMVALLLGPWVGRHLSERQSISLGLLMLAAGGSLPVFVQAYPLIFLGRLVLGFGIGLINEKAISLISTHFSGQERVQMLGLRGSAEVLGSAILTAVVGLILPLGWAKSFAIYLLAFVILGLYLAFVPETPVEEMADATSQTGRLSKPLWKRGIFLALIAFLVINANTVLTIKIPTMVETGGMGTASQSSLVLSGMMMMGILAGAVFSPLTKFLGKFLLPVAIALFSLSLMTVGFSSHFWGLTIGALISGFFYSVVLTNVFKSASDNVSAQELKLMTTIVLIGCNLGGASSSILPALLSQVVPNLTGLFIIYGSLGLAMGALVLVKSVYKKK